MSSSDACDRLTKKQHWPWGSTWNRTQVLQEQTDQEVDYYYDTNPIDANYSAQAAGRMTAVKFANGYSYQYSYNQPGRVVKQKLQLPDKQNDKPVEFESQYAWDNEGRMTSQSYPAQDAQTAGPQYGYQFDAMGRTSSMTGPPYNLTIATAAYGPAGELTSLNGDTRTYNILGQLTRITGGGIDLEYVYTPGQNNGRITQQIDHVSGEQVTYQYDQLNRLSHAETLDNSWGYTYSYDGFGNLTAKIVTKGTGLTSFSATYDALNHAVGTTYDANGNSGVQGDVAYPYDVENRLAMDQGMYGTRNYVYDPWGKRVGWRHRQTVYPVGYDAETKCGVYFYGVTGQKLAEYSCGYHDASGGDGTFYWSLKGYNVYFAGQMIQSNGVSVTTDRLGSVRKNGNGETFKYLPYGEELTSTADDREKFGTYFRDAIDPSYGRLALDYADQRYYDRGSGRFLTPDPLGLAAADSRNPNTWNAYAYVVSDPVNGSDPTGTDSEGPPADGCYVNGIWNSGCDFAIPKAPSSPTAWTRATQRLEAAEEGLLARTTVSADCQSDLDALSEASGSIINLYSIQEALSETDFKNGTTSNLPVSALYGPGAEAAGAAFQRQEDAKFGAGQTIGNEFGRNPGGLTAVTVLNGRTMFINPSLIGSNLANNESLLFHEALHELGLVDSAIQAALGLKVDDKNTKNITNKLSKDCIKGKANR